MQLAQVNVTQSQVTATSYDEDQLHHLQREDPHLSRVLYYVEKASEPHHKEYKNEHSEVKKYLRHWKQLKIKNDILYRVLEENNVTKHILIIPNKLKDTVLQQMHTMSGHQGIDKTLSLVRSRYYWSTLNQDVTDFVKQCKRCAIAKEPLPRIKAKMQHLIASKPLDIVAIDFTVLEVSKSGVENVLVMTDVFSKFTLAVPTKDQTSRTVAKVLIKEWINKLGIPKRIHSDRGKSFDSNVIKELYS